MPERFRVEKLCRWTEPHRDRETGEWHDVLKRCRKWDDCAGRTWYAIGDIEGSYCRYQILWILTKMIEWDWDEEDLVAARITWPTEPVETGYTDAELTQSSRKVEPGYQQVLRVISEVLARLEKTEEAGVLLWNAANNPENFQTGTANENRANIDGIQKAIRDGFPDWRKLPPEARAALGYASGAERKRMGYKEWKYYKQQREDVEKLGSQLHIT